MLTGPNDVSHVVLATSKYFLSFFSFFINTNYYIQLLLIKYAMWRLGECGDDVNGPKRHVTRRLGH
jgi:hypothetical protein